MNKLTIALIASLGFAGQAAAESTTGNAYALLLDTMTFVEDQIVDFKTIPNGTGTCTMASTGVLSGLCAGSPDGTPGQITVSGSANQAVDVSVGSGSTDAGVTYNPILASSGTTSDSTSIGATGSASISIIGNLGMVAAAGGARNLTYTLTVNYQ